MRPSVRCSIATHRLQAFDEAARDASVKTTIHDDDTTDEHVAAVPMPPRVGTTTLRGQPVPKKP